MNDPNENRPGYKLTKVGWIPEEWECVRLGDCLNEIQGGYSANAEDRIALFGEVAVLKLSALRQNRFAPEQHKTVTDRGEIDALRTPALRRTLIISRANTPDLVGSLVHVAHNYPTLFLSDLMWRLSPNSSADWLWLGYQLMGERSSRRLKSGASGSSRSMVKITKSSLSKLFIPLPPLPEQEKIAEILSTWDEVITQTEALLAAKTRQKKALMHHLLTGKTRLPGFEGEWEEKKLGQLVTPVSRATSKPSEPYIAIGLRSHCKGTFHREVADPSKVAMDTLYKLKRGDLVVNITFAWEGAIAIAKSIDEQGFVSHRFPAYEPTVETTSDFLQFVITTERMIWDLALISPGGAGRNRVLNKNDFLKLQIPTPPLPEQRAIATVLTDAETELTHLRSKLASLRQQKKSLMQKLLTGQVRVVL